MRRGLTNQIVAPRADACMISRYMFEMLMKLPLDTRGFAPSTSRASVLAMSGIGWIVDEPNTASLPANLLAQSCVPDEK